MEHASCAFCISWHHILTPFNLRNGWNILCGRFPQTQMSLMHNHAHTLRPAGKLPRRRRHIPQIRFPHCRHTHDEDKHTFVEDEIHTAYKQVNIPREDEGEGHVGINRDTKQWNVRLNPFLQVEWSRKSDLRLIKIYQTLSFVYPCFSSCTFLPGTPPKDRVVEIPVQKNVAVPQAPRIVSTCREVESNYMNVFS